MKIVGLMALLLLAALAAACGGPVQQACGNDYDTEECYDAISESAAEIEEFEDCDEDAIEQFPLGEFLTAASAAESDASRGEYDPDTLRKLHRLVDDLIDAC